MNTLSDPVQSVADTLALVVTDENTSLEDTLTNIYETYSWVAFLAVSALLISIYEVFLMIFYIIMWMEYMYDSIFVTDGGATSVVTISLAIAPFIVIALLA